MFLSSTKKHLQQQYTLLAIILKRKDEEKQTYSPRPVGRYHILTENEKKERVVKRHTLKEKRKGLCSFISLNLYSFELNVIFRDN